MGRIGDLGWAIRDRLSGTAVAVVLALGGLGAGVAGLLIALDARDKAEEAASTSTVPVSIPTTTVPPQTPDESARVDELNERVAAIEESVARLSPEGGGRAPSSQGGSTPPEEAPVPETPELPEGIEVPGVPPPGSGGQSRP